MTFEQWLQSRLTAHGFACGPIDGVLGDLTTKAIRAFEASRGLPQNGTADAKVIELLRQTSSAISPRVAAAIPNRDVPAPTPVGPVSSPFPRQAGVPVFYGAVGTNQTTIELPYDMAIAWDRGTRVKRMTLHKLVAPSALAVLQAVAALYSAEERRALGLDVFGGSLNVRRMRGGSAYSMHSWGIAIDFDPERNGLSTHAPAARLSHSDARPFWQAWEAAGWLSLGRARDFDWMHVQAARL